jgi:hypothetical protein
MKIVDISILDACKPMNSSSLLSLSTIQTMNTIIKNRRFRNRSPKLCNKYEKSKVPPSEAIGMINRENSANGSHSKGLNTIL